MGYFLGDASIWIMDQPNLEREGGRERERKQPPPPSGSSDVLGT